MAEVGVRISIYPPSNTKCLCYIQPQIYQ